MQKFRLIFMLLLGGLLLSACGPEPIYTGGYAMQQIIWSPDQKSIIFSYTYKIKHPPPGTNIPLNMSPTLIDKTFLYRIKTDGTELEVLLDPGDKQAAQVLDAVGMKIIGWDGPNLLIVLKDGYYLFDPVTRKLEKRFEITDLSKRFGEYYTINPNCFFQGKWLLANVSVFANSRPAYQSIIFNLENPEEVKFIDIEKKTEYSLEIPKIISCAPYGSHVFYDKTGPKPNDRSIMQVVERGIADLDIANAIIKNPIRLPDNAPNSNRTWGRLVSWVSPTTLLYMYGNSKELKVTESETISHPSGEIKKYQSEFLTKSQIIAISPDFKQVVTEDFGTLHIANIDGSNKKFLLKYPGKLPAGELTTLQ